MIRKQICYLCLFFVFSSTLIFAKSNVKLRLPVRIFVGTSQVKELDKEKFTLFINNKKIKIFNILTKNKSIGKKSDMGRNFILSFQTTEYDQQVSTGIFHFITQILDTTDRLIILTPLKIHKMEVSRNKTSMLVKIEKLLRNDFLTCKQLKFSVEESLKNKINKLKRSLIDSYKNIFNFSQSNKDAIRFLNTYPKEFQNFKNEFLVPNYRIIKLITELMATSGGERWWIHFQHRDISPLFSMTKVIINMIKDYESLHYNKLNIDQRIAQLKKQLQFSSSFPQYQFSRELINNHINYNVIIMGKPMDCELHSSVAEFLDLEKIFKNLTLYTGGMMVCTTDVIDGLKNISRHTDYYYELVYNFNGQFERKNIRVGIPDQKKSLYYRKSFSRDEMESLITFLTTQKIHIEKFSFYEKYFNFLVTKFKLDETGNFGILKIFVCVVDYQKNVVYKEKKILRTFKDKVSISLPLPSLKTGTYELILSVYDLIANHYASLQHNFYFHEK